MYIDTEGIIFRHTKPVNGRSMVHIFTKKYGKISAGTGISPRGKGKSNLAMKPFTYGRYELYKNRDNFNVNGAETIASYYRIGEDVDKYMNASYILEFTSKVLPEQMPNPKIFNLLIDFLEEMQKRKGKYATLVVAYEIKVLKELGYMPRLETCIECGTKDNLHFLDIKDGGTLCRKCGGDKIAFNNDTLIYEAGLGIINILSYFARNPLKNFQNLALGEEPMKVVRTIIDEYLQYHLDIGELKSQGFLTKE